MATSGDVTWSMEPKDLGKVIAVRGEYTHEGTRHRCYTKFNTPSTPTDMEALKVTAKNTVTAKINVLIGE